jgi:hypothetical protein
MVAKVFFGPRERVNSEVFDVAWDQSVAGWAAQAASAAAPVRNVLRVVKKLPLVGISV